MATLASELRAKLERVVIEAREVAEEGARAALEGLAVHHQQPYSHINPFQRSLRNHLRARSRQLGDRQDSGGRLTIDHLVGECAYEHWHRIIFARFLAENNLLIEPTENISISLDEAKELAKEAGMNVWEFASRCAQRMLPQIFRPDDPLLQVTFAKEYILKLEELMSSLEPTIFKASDSLGWLYQFWQSKKKDEINRSEIKIGADEISAVTQLFTEPYMVSFLLQNTLGAWWAGRKLSAKDAAAAKSEDELCAKIALPGIGWEYLRFVRGADGKGGPWRPAAGTFDGWPKTAAELRVLDPCCGSGHFLVAALHHLVPIRMAEEGMTAVRAVDAVLRDNLHGLEIDERCCQIAAFALAFAAWTYPDASGYRPLPELNIACTGIGPHCTTEQWVKLAEQAGMPTAPDHRERIRNGLLNLHRLFLQAPTLGSLISPAELPADLISADYETIQPYLTAILKAEKVDDETRERAIAAAGMVKAADLLAGEYTLVITNVPYLGRGKQTEAMKVYCQKMFPLSQWDLATCLLERSLLLCGAGGTAALVVPQNWLFLTTFTKLRKQLLPASTWNLLARLGVGAFDTQMWDFNVMLLALTNLRPDSMTHYGGLDVSQADSPSTKNALLATAPIRSVIQLGQLRNPDARVGLADPVEGDLLGEFVEVPQGIKTGDDSRFRMYFWEVAELTTRWPLYQSTPDTNQAFSGMSNVLRWEDEGRDIARLQGQQAWGHNGLAVSQMANMPWSHYGGAIHDSNINVIVPKNLNFLPAIVAYGQSEEFRQEVRRLDQKLSVTNATFKKVPFNLDHWQKVAAKKYPDGLPEPESNDPTQWLFHGRPNEAQEGTELQVAVTRLLGYRWPAELDDKMRQSKRARALVNKCGELARFADNDGIVCISAVRGEDSAAERLLRLLTACGIELGVDLDGWLRNSFFEEHCKLFHDRPFVWHVWDGRKRDGFHALVNYHKLCETDGKGRKLLESLTYSYLGDWISRQKDGIQRGEGGAEDRWVAALELKKRLELILGGEPPFDMFVRWKPLGDQPVGWEPDINDGVRLNIRPFLASDLPNGRMGAGVLRHKPNIKWGKDRGKEPQRPKENYPWFWGWDEKSQDFMGGKQFNGNRWNACHYSLKVKQAARDAALVKKGMK